MIGPGRDLAVETEARRFYDGGLDAFADQPEVPPNPHSDAQVELVRITREDGGEEFAMLRRIAYRDRHLGELLVPKATQSFTTDLTSVPALFTWLVPKTGRHLPAALVHDGLVHEEGHPDYVSTEGHVVRRVEADRVLRDAMADTGTGVVRRWLVWSAVATATMFSGAGTGWSPARAWRYRLTAGLSVVVVALLGLLATADLLDATWFWALPWMDERGWQTEVLGGLAGAVVVPLALAVLWGRFRVAGAVVGVALAVLLHVTVLLLALTAGYQATEWAARKAPVPALAAVVVLVGTALGFFVGLLVG